MKSRDGGVQRHNLKAPNGFFQPAAAPFATGVVSFRLDPKPQFRKRYGAEGDRLGRPRTQPGGQVESAPFVRYQN